MVPDKRRGLRRVHKLTFWLFARAVSDATRDGIGIRGPGLVNEWLEVKSGRTSADLLLENAKTPAWTLRVPRSTGFVSNVTHLYRVLGGTGRALLARTGKGVVLVDKHAKVLDRHASECMRDSSYAYPVGGEFQDFWKTKLRVGRIRDVKDGVCAMDSGGEADSDRMIELEHPGPVHLVGMPGTYLVLRASRRTSEILGGRYTAPTAAAPLVLLRVKGPESKLRPVEALAVGAIKLIPEREFLLIGASVPLYHEKVTVDLRGDGTSDRPSTNETLDLTGDDEIEEIEEISGDPIDIREGEYDATDTSGTPPAHTRRHIPIDLTGDEFGFGFEVTEY
jgi:hypothetical protein